MLIKSQLEVHLHTVHRHTGHHVHFHPSLFTVRLTIFYVVDDFVQHLGNVVHCIFHVHYTLILTYVALI